MSIFFLTLVASEGKLEQNTINIVGDYAEAQWLSTDKAVDIKLLNPLGSAALAYIREQLAKQKVDVFYTAEENRRKKLILADMDSTIVTEETLDELAAHAGIKDKISAITAHAMNGELDFHEALRERVDLLKGLSADTLDQTLEKTPLTSGAKTFIRTMKKFDATCVLVSGGFTFFTSAIAQKVGFDQNHGNQLEIENNQLTGNVIEPILDKESKLTFLKQYCKKLDISLDQALTIGDGANDLPMLQAAGLGLGFHAKPSVAAQLDNMIIFGDLTCALYAQGINENDFAA